MLHIYQGKGKQLQTIFMLLQRNNREGFKPDPKHIVTKKKGVGFKPQILNSTSKYNFFVAAYNYCYFFRYL